MIGSPERKFYFRLAHELGMTVAQMLASLDSAELTEWMALLSSELWGKDRADYWLGLNAVASINPYRSKHDEPLKVSDLMPDAMGNEEDTGPTPEEVWRKMRAWAGMMQGMEQAGTLQGQRPKG